MGAAGDQLDVRTQLARDYTEALRAHISGAGEAGLTRAYELGRRAVSQGIGVLDLATLHHEALLELNAAGQECPVNLSGEFFAECISPFEMTLRLDRELRKAKEAAEAANRELESFSYSVAHDLRAPLRSLDGFSNMLIEDCRDRLSEDGHRYLKHIRDAVQQMRGLIEGLLELSRVARGAIGDERVDLSALVEHIAKRLRAAEPGRQVEFAVQPGVFAFGDPHLLRAVLENLLGNAWKFTGKRERARIEFGQRHEGDETANFIRDNGAGFDMAHAAKLFGVFQRLHGAEEFQGTGIGLATVQRIVRRHGGRVWAEGAVGEGATFYFALGEAARGRV
jgi:light-regulated signal transduction histidine kinase (bacteriophytochrome)